MSPISSRDLAHPFFRREQPVEHVQEGHSLGLADRAERVRQRLDLVLPGFVRDWRWTDHEHRTKRAGLTDNARGVLNRLLKANSPLSTYEQGIVPANEVDIDEEIRALFGVEPEELKQVSVERMREILSKCSGSLAADIIADRADRL